MKLFVGGSRPWKALGLFVILTLLLGSGLGFAQAAGVGDDGYLTVARPGPGDWASYSGREVILDDALAQASGGRITTYEIEWLPQTTFRTSDHQEIDAMRILQTFEWMGDITQFRETFYDVATHEAIGDAGYGTFKDNSFSCSGVCFNGVGAIGSGGEEYSTRYSSYEAQNGPCGFLNALHGRLYDPEQPFTERSHCDVVTGQHELTFESIGTDRIAGHEVHGFEAQQVPGLQLWYADGIPFPVRFVSTMSDHFYTPYTYGRAWEMTLVDFRTGGSSYDWPEETVVHSQGKVALAPLTPWSLDDSGVDVPFPLSEAMQNLDRDVLSEQPIADWLVAHPQAYVAQAWSASYRDGSGGAQHHWWVAWTDGVETTARAFIAYPAGPSLLGGPAGYVVTVQPYTFEGQEDWVLPPKALVPSELPRVADVMAEYKERQDPALQPNAPNRYGWGISCRDQTCRHIQEFVVGGYALTQGVMPLVPGFSSPLLGAQGTDLSQLMVNATGHALRVYAYQQEADGATALVSEQQGDNIGAVQRGEIREGSVWRMPAGEAAAGIGFAAILISAFYYFWPALKALPVFSMFSRISADKVLENPNRARVMQVVEADPGVHFQEISRRTGLGRGALDHHLRKLVQAGLVAAKVGAGYTCYFPRGVDRRVMAAAGTLKSAGAQRIMEVLANGRTRSVQDIAAATGLSPSTVSHHLGRMRQAGLVDGGGRAGYRATEVAAL